MVQTKKQYPELSMVYTIINSRRQGSKPTRSLCEDIADSFEASRSKAKSLALQPYTFS
jgi:hypothetical protein